MDDSEGPGTVKRRYSLHRPTTQQFLGAAVVVLAVISVILVTYQRTELRSTTACYAQFATSYSEALRARDNDAQRARNDLIEYTVASAALWQGFLTNAPPPGQQSTPEQRAASLKVLDRYFASNTNYVASLRAVQEAAKRHPIPAVQC